MTSLNVGNDIVTQFIMSPYMKNLVKKTYVSNFDKIIFEDFHTLLDEFIEEDGNKEIWIYEDVGSDGELDKKYKWDMLEPGENEFYRTLSLLLNHFLMIRHQILEDIKNGEFDSVNPLIIEIFVYKGEDGLLPNDVCCALRDDHFLKSSRCHRYAMDVLICNAMYYHVYKEEGSCRKFKRFSSGLFSGIRPFRVGTNIEYLHDIRKMAYPETELETLGETEMPKDGSIVKFQINNKPLEDLLSGLYDNIDKRTNLMKDRSIPQRTQTALLAQNAKEIEYQVREIIKFNNPDEPSLNMMDKRTCEEFQQAIIYNKLTLKIYNCPGVTAFSVVMSGICGLIFDGTIAANLTINNIYEPAHFDMPDNIEIRESFERVKTSKNVMVGKLTKTIYEQLTTEANTLGISTSAYIDLIKSKPERCPKELIRRIGLSVRGKKTGNTTDEVLDWYLNNLGESGFETYLNYEDRGRTNVGWLRPTFKCSNDLENNKLKHVLWMPHVYNNEVYGQGNCALYSYILRYMVDKTALNFCTDKYKWLFVPFIRLCKNKELHKMGTFFSPVIRLFRRDYSDRMVQSYVLQADRVNKDHWCMKEPINTNTHLDDFVLNYDTSFKLDYVNNPCYGAISDIEFECIENCVDHYMGVINVYYNTTLFHMMCRMMLKKSLGDSKVNSILLSQCNMLTSFKSSTDEVKLNGGFHARVLYKSDIDLSTLSNKFSEGFEQAKAELKRQINDVTKNIKEQISEKGEYDLLVYAALYYVYVHGDKTGLFDAYKSEDAFSTKPFIDTYSELIPWIETNARGCLFLKQPENKLLLEMYYISYYVFKFMKVKDIWCICDINNETLMCIPLIQDLLGLKTYHIYGISCYVVLDDYHAIDEKYLWNLTYRPVPADKVVVVDTIRYIDKNKFKGTDIAPEVRLRVGTDWKTNLEYDKAEAEKLYQQIKNKNEIVEAFHERMLNDDTNLETEFCKVMMKLNGNHMNTCFRTLHPYIFYFDESHGEKEYHLHPDITYTMDSWENSVTGKNYNNTQLYQIIPRMSLETNNEINPDFSNLSWTSIFLGGGKSVLDWIVKWIVIVLIIIVLVVILRIMNERRSLVIIHQTP